MKKPACIVPWISLWPISDGRVLPCCTADIRAEKSLLGNLNNQSFEEAFNSKNSMNLRKTFMSGQLDPDVCSECIKREDANDSSNRTTIEEHFPNLTTEFFQNTREDGHFPDFKILYADTLWSNICNFKCIHCNPNISSSIASDKILSGFYKHDGGRLKSLGEDRLQEFLTHIPHLEVIHFNGGEPLLMKQYYIILEKLLEQKRTDVKLWLHTNGCIPIGKSKKMYKLLSQFNSVNLTMSHDGYGSIGQFVRSGYSDDLFIKNYWLAKEYLDNIIFAISVHAFNVVQLPDLLNWYRDNNLRDELLNGLSVSIVYNPEHLGLWNLNQELKEKVSKSLSEWLEVNEPRPNALVTLNTIIKLLRKDQSIEQYSKLQSLAKAHLQSSKKSFSDVYNGKFSHMTID